MGCFVVDKTHIDAMVEVAIRGPRDRQGGWYRPVCWDLNNADALGQMLWMENHRSVSYRYPDSVGQDLPGPAGLTLADIEAYRFTSSHQLSAVEALKAISCYEYQACETPDWKESEAYKFCDSLRGMLISVLPGYAAAAWGIEDPSTEDEEVS